VDKASIRRELGFKEDDLVVGMVANYDRPIKGVTYFLESIPSILREVPSARFLIVGKGGKEEGPMRERAKSLAIDSVLTFSGYQNIVSKYYQIMDISTMTSLTEGLSITLLESMSFCLPVVATNVGGNPEVVVDSYTGFLVPPKDIHSFAERVVHLLRNPDLRLRMGQEGRRRVEEKFQMTNVSRQYTQLYRDLIEVGR
jgi:glycosyltransferase involved in cell wall biosynthesis